MAKKNEFIKVKSLEHLKTILKENDNGTLECFIETNGGGRSWKTITYANEDDKDGNPKFEILNEIDETRQVLTEKNLFNERYTNIGKAIENGSFFFAWS